jgi:hypothetical protein
MIESPLRWVCGFCLLFASSALVGCGKSDGKLSVTGSVKFPDGSIPKGQASGYVEFAPTDGGTTARGANGVIDKETGEFVLTTMQPGDGIAPGEYTVTLRVNANYPPRPDGSSSVVPLEYTNASSTPLSAKVDAEHTRFDFEVPKRGAGGKKPKR